MSLKQYLLAVSIAASLIPAQHAFAGGSGVVGGGDAIICFREQAFGKNSASNLDAYYMKDADGRLSQEGRKYLKSIISAVPFDLYQIERSNRSRFLDDLRAKSPSFKVALRKIDQRFARVPGFFQRLKWARKQLGLLGSKRTFPMPGGVAPVRDSGVLEDESEFEVLILPRNCMNLQAVRREGLVMSYDPLLWGHFDGVSRAVMQVHEEIYFLEKLHAATSGTDVQNSINTRYIMKAFLGHDLEHATLLQAIHENGFDWAVKTRAQAQKR